MPLDDVGAEKTEENTGFSSSSVVDLGGIWGVREGGGAFSCESAGIEVGVFADRTLRLASGV